MFHCCGKSSGAAAIRLIRTSLTGFRRQPYAPDKCIRGKWISTNESLMQSTGAVKATILSILVGWRVFLGCCLSAEAVIFKDSCIIRHFRLFSGHMRLSYAVHISPVCLPLVINTLTIALFAVFLFLLLILYSIPESLPLIIATISTD